MSDGACPIYAPFFSGMGCTAAIVLSCMGASYGTAKSGIGIISTGILHPEHTVKNLVPVVMSSVIAIFGLIVGVLITGQHEPGLSLFSALTQLSAGITMGLCGLASGFSIGIIGDCGVRANSQQPRILVWACYRVGYDI
ncbi:hypothetical protein VHEMI05239 [[Torrubiella] hemipterigena]|uniref:V-type proton ATPase proteolipid subunit n=1 Tax=[Torrubiella] hemipterigena TaxID=1531966 RepID=A0A0A1TG49_9HYPO|nr:hypothetical protein VHEMI05239 [[Torrubiella] hemipterigena]